MEINESEFLKSPKYKQSLIMECQSYKYKIMCYSNKNFMPRDNCLRYKTHEAHITHIIISSFWFRLILQETEIYRIYWGLRAVKCMYYKLYANVR